MPHREQAVGKTDEWYTPPRLFNAMGVVFDLDVAHPGLDIVNWIPANRIITHNSLSSKWEGFVWCNPPFGGRNGLDPWLAKFFDHGDGVILTPDRTSAPWWQKHAPKADAILFVSPRVHFIPKEGKTSSPAQGTTLMASGEKGVNALRNAQQNGLGWMVTVRAAALKETGGMSDERVGPCGEHCAVVDECDERGREITRLRAENEKLRTATTELLSHYYDAMRRDGYADEEVRSEHVFLAAAAALKETGDE